MNYAPEVLRDPIPHERLRGRTVVHLARYGVRAVARYEQVGRPSTDGKFCSSAGAGTISAGRPWRTQSVAGERSAAARCYRGVVCSALATELKELRPHFEANGRGLVDSWSRVERLTRPRTRVSVEVFPDAVGIDDAGREHLLLCGDMAHCALVAQRAAAGRPCRRLNPSLPILAVSAEEMHCGHTDWGRFMRRMPARYPSQMPALLVRSLLTASR